MSALLHTQMNRQKKRKKERKVIIISLSNYFYFRIEFEIGRSIFDYDTDMKAALRFEITLWSYFYSTFFLNRFWITNPKSKVIDTNAFLTNSEFHIYKMTTNLSEWAITFHRHDRFHLRNVLPFVVRRGQYTLIPVKSGLHSEQWWLIWIQLSIEINRIENEVTERLIYFQSNWMCDMCRMCCGAVMQNRKIRLIGNWPMSISLIVESFLVLDLFQFVDWDGMVRHQFHSITGCEII